MMSVIFRIFKHEKPSTRLQLLISQAISINSRLEVSLALSLLFLKYEKTIFASVVCYHSTCKYALVNQLNQLNLLLIINQLILVLFKFEKLIIINNDLENYKQVKTNEIMF